MKAYASLRELDILEKIGSWSGDEPGLGEAPALAGSLPLDLALESSDLDIITYASDLKIFGAILRREFGSLDGFQSARGIVLGVATLITKFHFQDEDYEIFTQSTLVPQQNAVIHLLVEERILSLGGAGFRDKIWTARRSGLKTEPAFGRVLGLEEPYRELLQFEDFSDDEIRERFRDKF